MKLSKAQEAVMTKAKKDIDLARTLDYPEWLRATNHVYQNTNEYWERQYQKAVAKGHLKEFWEAEREGIVLTHCNSKTLWVLESLGLIEIIDDSCGSKGSGIDTVKILNY